MKQDPAFSVGNAGLGVRWMDLDLWRDVLLESTDIGFLIRPKVIMGQVH